MKVIKCPHCGKINEILSNSTHKYAIELSHTEPEKLLNRRCNKCDKHFDVKVSVSNITTVKS